MTSRAARALRGASFAAIAVLLAAGAHTLAGGGAPSPLFCAIAAVLATPPAMLLAGARVRAWRTVAAVVVSQAVFHVAFSVFGDLGRWDAAPSGHVHGGDLLLSPVPDAAPLTVAMIAAHGAAAALSALAVRHGERAVVAVWRWARALLVRMRVTSLPVPRARGVVLRFLVRVALHIRVAAQPSSRRGPPAFIPA